MPYPPVFVGGLHVKTIVFAAVHEALTFVGGLGGPGIVTYNGVFRGPSPTEFVADILTTVIGLDMSNAVYGIVYVPGDFGTFTFVSDVYAGTPVIGSNEI
jgi:hypothetical protein